MEILSLILWIPFFNTQEYNNFLWISFFLVKKSARSTFLLLARFMFLSYVRPKITVPVDWKSVVFHKYVQCDYM